jgi:PadR family transcriptional regulator PadR
MELSAWQAQVRKGAAELAVLAVLSRGEAYGLEILERAKGGGELVAEGALYQLLNRLERDGKLTSRWVTNGGGHPRKYYVLTEEGARLFAQMQAVWTDFSNAMSDLLEQAK